MPCSDLLVRPLGRDRSIVRLARVLAGVVALAAAAPAPAQGYPTQPIHVIVTSSAGSTGDTLIRALGGPLAKALGQSLVIENAPGSGGVTATEHVVRAPKDGYTLGLISNNHAINPNIYKTINFDSLKDITPISVLGTTPVVLVVNPAVPAKNVQELIALAKARPGALNYGSAGNGTVLHLAGVLFVSEAGIDVHHVPYKGLSQMIGDLMSGQLEMGFAGIASVAGQIKGGKLRALGVSTAQRSPVLPDVPTLVESGLPNYRFEGWLALVGPSGLAPAIVNRLNAEVTAALATREIQEALSAQGVVTVGSSPQAAAQFIAGEMDKHAKLVKRSGATLE